MITQIKLKKYFSYMHKSYMRWSKYFLFVLVLLIFNSCERNFPIEPEQLNRGDIISTSEHGTFTISVIQQIVTNLIEDIPVNIDLRYDVEAYKIIYRTVDPKGNIVNASGVVFIPKGKEINSLVSLHHGTQTKRTMVGSENVLNAFDGLIAASLGYYAVVPDYLGLGVSNILHPYHHAETSANTVIDMIRAARKFAQTKNVRLNGQVFIAGYSEGGFVTMAAHKEIEKNYRNEITVSASAPMAGAYDLNFTARTILQRETYDQPSFLSFFFVTFNSIYGWNRINDVFNSPYAEKIPALFDGTKTTTEISRELNNSINQLFKQKFIDDFLNGNETEIINAFTENSVVDWKPVAPMRLYHGNADEFVDYENSVRARDNFLSLGANVELITIEGGTHYTSALPSIVSAIEWFEALRLNKYLANNN